MKAVTFDEFTPVQASSMHFDQGLSGPCDRHGNVAQFDGVWHILDVHPVRFHDQMPLKIGLRFSMKAFRPSA